MKLRQTKLQRWKRHLPDFWLIAEAAVLSLLVRLLLQVVPFRHLAAKFGLQSANTAGQRLNKRGADLPKIGWVAEAISQKFGWRNPCLVSAIVAKLMLSRRDVIGLELVLGVQKDQANKLIAHAWLKHGELIVTGGTQSERYVPITSFTA